MVASMPTIKSVMTPFPWSVASGDSVAEARQVMARHGIHHLPVKQGDEIVGLLYARDLEGAAAAGQLEWPAGQLCRRDPLVVSSDQPLDRVLEEMAQRRLDVALVLRDRKLVGIFTLSDVCSRYAALLRDRFPSGGGDEAA